MALIELIAVLIKVIDTGYECQETILHYVENIRVYIGP